MASAIVKGIIKNNYVASTDIYLFDVMTEKVNFLSKENNTNVCISTSELIASVDTVVLSVKPNIIEKILTENRKMIIEKNLC